MAIDQRGVDFDLALRGNALLDDLTLNLGGGSRIEGYMSVYGNYHYRKCNDIMLNLYGNMHAWPHAACVRLKGLGVTVLTVQCGWGWGCIDNGRHSASSG